MQNIYRLHCFAQSGNCYKVAMYLELSNLNWEAVCTDYFNGETLSPEFRNDLNIQGECPVLEHNDDKLTQSGAILSYLVDETGHFAYSSPQEKYEVLRWLLFDNHKFTSSLATYRYNHFIQPNILKKDVADFVKARLNSALSIIESQLQQHTTIANTQHLSIADLSLSAYLLYPEEEHGLNLQQNYPAIHQWLNTIRQQPRWKSPYELMPTATMNRGESV